MSKPDFKKLPREELEQRLRLIYGLLSVVEQNGYNFQSAAEWCLFIARDGLTPTRVDLVPGQE